MPKIQFLSFILPKFLGSRPTPGYELCLGVGLNNSADLAKCKIAGMLAKADPEAEPDIAWVKRKVRGQIRSRYNNYIPVAYTLAHT